MAAREMGGLSLLDALDYLILLLRFSPPAGGGEEQVQSPLSTEPPFPTEVLKNSGSLEPHEIRTADEFEAACVLSAGVLVITDAPTDKATAHRPNCWTVRP